jgi:large subunit ribosomal protein L10
LAKIRRAIKGVPVTKGMLEDVQEQAGEPSEVSPPPPTEESLEPIKATFTIARTGLLSAVVRSGNTPTASLSPLLSGPVALLTTPSLSPPYLKSLFAAMNKSLGYRPPPSTSASTPTSSRLILLGALLEGNKVLSASEITSLVASTPELSTLRAQLVGLLEMPGRSLLGVTQMAGGGGLVRTLMGLEAGLKEGQEKEEGAGEVKPERGG